jgi:hypothetical protein
VTESAISGSHRLSVKGDRNRALKRRLPAQQESSKSCRALEHQDSPVQMCSLEGITGMGVTKKVYLKLLQGVMVVSRLLSLRAVIQSPPDGLQCNLSSVIRLGSTRHNPRY